jgi:hypothetical protein
MVDAKLYEYLVTSSERSLNMEAVTNQLHGAESFLES